MKRALFYLVIIAAAVCGCRKDTFELAPPSAPIIYYLYPGEPATVEGPQLLDADWLILLEERDEYYDELVRLTGEN